MPVGTQDVPECTGVRCLAPSLQDQSITDSRVAQWGGVLGFLRFTTLSRPGGARQPPRDSRIVSEVPLDHAFKLAAHQTNLPLGLHSGHADRASLAFDVM